VKTRRKSAEPNLTYKVAKSSQLLRQGYDGQGVPQQNGRITRPAVGRGGKGGHKPTKGFEGESRDEEDPSPALMPVDLNGCPKLVIQMGDSNG
jgi:hypothetical protein